MSLKQVNKKTYQTFICNCFNKPVQATHDLLLHINSENRVIARVIFDNCCKVRYYVTRGKL